MKTVIHSGKISFDNMKHACFFLLNIVYFIISDIAAKCNKAAINKKFPIIDKHLYNLYGLNLNA